MYRYKPKPRDRNKFFSVRLSEKDEYVPKDYIGMYSIFRNPKNSSVYMGEEHCQKLRNDTFEDILKLFKEYGSPSFSDLWNYNRKIITEAGMNHFLFHPKIAPIAKMIRCFEVIKKETHKKKTLVVSFGINKDDLIEYFKTGKTKSPRRSFPKKSQNIVLFGAEDIKIDGSIILRIERSALYWQFQHWCLLNGISEDDGILMALEEVIKAYPQKSLKERREYDFPTAFDEVIMRKPENGEPEECTFLCQGSVYALADRIIDRWNRDPDNITKKKMDFGTYCNNALLLLNKSMPLKYSNPELYAEEKEAEAFQTYSEKVHSLK